MRPVSSRYSTTQLALVVSFSTFLVIAASTSSAQSVVATSTGGTRNWEDPAAWSFDLPPTTATIPDNDSVNFFDVRIDGGSSTTTEVSLSTAVTVDRMEIAAGDSLVINDAAGLTIDRDPSRVGSGQILNDGTIAINGATATTRLDTAGTLSLSGGGSLRMMGGAAFGTFSTALSSPFITQQAGHRIEGSGVILQNLTNEGTISANSSDALFFDGVLLQQRGTLEATGAGGLMLRARGGVENTGTVRAAGSSISTFSMANDGLIEVTQGGQFSVLGDITNNGLVEITQGSEFSVGSQMTNEATGRIVVSGAGSRFATVPLVNRGTFEVLDGATANFDGFVAGGTVRIGANAVVDGGIRVNVPGVLDLAGGVIRSQGGGMRVSGRGRVEGTGRIELGGGELGFDLLGVLAPGGAGGIGRLDVVGDLSVGSTSRFARQQIEIQLRGTGQGEYDIVSVDGTMSLIGSVLVDLANLADPTDPTAVFDPSAGSVFDILVASNIVDLGGTLTLPTFDDGRDFMQEIVRVGSVDILRLVVVPEPSTAVLLATGFMLLASTKRSFSNE